MLHCILTHYMPNGKFPCTTQQQTLTYSITKRRSNLRPHPNRPNPKGRHASSRDHAIFIGRSSEPVVDRDSRSDGPARSPVAAVLGGAGAHGWAPALGPIPQNGSPPVVVSFVFSHSRLDRLQLARYTLLTHTYIVHASQRQVFIMSSNFEAAHICCC